MSIAGQEVDHGERSYERRPASRAAACAHYAAENANDLDRIMGTFSTAGGTTMIYNHQPFTDPDGIRAAHTYIGFSAAGAFEGLQTVADHEHLTADEIVVEGRLRGKHVGEFQVLRRPAATSSCRSSRSTASTTAGSSCRSAS